MSTLTPETVAPKRAETEEAVAARSARSARRGRMNLALNWVVVGCFLGAFAMLFLGALNGSFLWPSAEAADQVQDTSGRRNLVMAIQVLTVVPLFVFALDAWMRVLGFSGYDPRERPRKMLVAGLLALVVCAGLGRAGATTIMGQDRIIERAEVKYGVSIDRGRDAIGVDPSRFVIDGVKMFCQRPVFIADTFDPMLVCQTDASGDDGTPVELPLR